MQRGDTILLPVGPQRWLHLWIVCTRPLPVTTEAVVVGVTTLRNDADQTVLLAKGDHPFIKHDSVVRYSDARIYRCSKILAQVKSGSIETDCRCTDELIDQIEEGIWSSPFTPKKILRFMEEHL
jgi:hypothetical protein